MPSNANRWFVHTATVETYLGTGSTGDDFAAPVQKQGLLVDARQLVLAADGEQVVSESSFYTDLADADMYPVDTKVTVNGRSSRVLGTKRIDSGGKSNLDHLEVTLR